MLVKCSYFGHPILSTNKAFPRIRDYLNFTGNIFLLLSCHIPKKHSSLFTNTNNTANCYKKSDNASHILTSVQIL